MAVISSSFHFNPSRIAGSAVETFPLFIAEKVCSVTKLVSFQLECVKKKTVVC
jgi:hypothetical protein